MLFCISHAHSKYLTNHIIGNSAWIKCPEQTTRALKPGLPEQNEVIFLLADAGGPLVVAPKFWIEIRVSFIFRVSVSPPQSLEFTAVTVAARLEGRSVPSVNI